ncbi:phosphatase PAP2 family protein [Spirosoma aureum]|uniref:Phosphatase PAP2 family protein n=2 Tax=Spirosoma aureum TaxID=2692134 RepID=A0A6G9B0H4_9BACT|nr:phosphatase PAP2 family protein [Spirosoma aureum]
MPTLLFGILLYLAPSILGVDAFSGTLRISLLILIFIGTFGVPSLLIYYLFRSGYVRSLQLDTLDDRRLPYFLTAIVYTGLTFLFAFRMQLLSSIAPGIAILLGSITLSILLVGLISIYWQISAHSVGIGGVVGIVAGIITKFGETDLVLVLAALIMLAGMVASARLHLNAHTPSQIGAGLILGLSISMMTVFWLI